MKKLIIIIIVVILGLFILWIPKSEKKPLSSFDNRTYVIGTHEYTSRVVLTDARIKEAMKTSKDNIIYYKNAYGIWIDATTGFEIEELPAYFKISHRH